MASHEATGPQTALWDNQSLFNCGVARKPHGTPKISRINVYILKIGPVILLNEMM